jgi:hypothetical protein
MGFRGRLNSRMTIVGGRDTADDFEDCEAWLTTLRRHEAKRGSEQLVECVTITGDEGEGE